MADDGLEVVLAAWGAARRLRAGQAAALRARIKAAPAEELDRFWWRAVLANPVLELARGAGQAWLPPRSG